MIVALIGQNSIYKINLPNIARGNYWIKNDDDKKLLNIENTDGRWSIISNDMQKIIEPKKVNLKLKNNIDLAKNPQNVISSIYLKDYSTNYIALKGKKELFILYCMPDTEEFIKLDIKKSSEIVIGSSTQSNILYKNSLIEPKQAKIFFSNGKLMLENYSSYLDAFINNKPTLNRPRLLFNGDVVFLLGLKLIVMGRSIFINNPMGKVSFDGSVFEINKNEIDSPILDEEKEGDVELYEQKDYFARAPRITNVIEREKVRIDAPPQIQKKEGVPLIFLLGTSLAMGAIMLITGITTIQDIASGKRTFAESIPTLLITLAMLISIVLLPILNVKYERKQKIKYEKTRQKRYIDYTNSKIRQIDDIMNKQRSILFENYASLEECNNIIFSKNSRLWERKIDDNDFIDIRLGTGNIPLQIDVEYPQEGFSMEDDKLVEMLYKVGDEAKTLTNAPITMSFAKNNVSALLVQNNDRLVEKFIQSMIVQLITFQSYEDLKLVFLVKKDINKKWEHIKMLPHVWDNTKKIRFFADDYDDMQEISKYLEEELANRTNKRK